MALNDILNAAFGGEQAASARMGKMPNVRQPNMKSIPAPMPTPSAANVPAESSQSMAALIPLLLGQQGGNNRMGPGGSSTSDFNANNEGPGASGLTFGVQDPYYSSQARKLYNFIENRYPQVSMGGIFNARNIAGTNTPSEHAYGAALDTMVGSNNLGDMVYQLLMRPRVQDRFGYSNVLWEVPDHYNHLHTGWLY